VIDTDPQATAAAWSDWRGEEYQPQVVTSPPARLSKTIDQVSKIGIELVVIDTPPHADATARQAVKVADLVLVPTRARAFDLHALEGTAELVAYARKPAFVVLNGVPAGATRIVAEASDQIGELGLSLCPIHFGERADFHRTSATGEVAMEASPEGKAAKEVEALWKWVTKQIGMRRGQS
jgi:chromosome partitioning protein